MDWGTKAKPFRFSDYRAALLSVRVRRDPGASFGQFGRNPGASILTVDMNRIGHFYSPAQGKDQEEWLSLFAY